MKIKVCFVVLGLEFSGAENVLIQYLKGNEAIDPWILLIYDGDAYKRFADEFGADKVISLHAPYSKNTLRFLPSVSQSKVEKLLSAAVANIKPDVLYAQNTLEVMLCGSYVKKSELPAVGHIHDMMDAYGTPAKIKETRKAFEGYKKIYTVSEACKASWGEDRLEVVYNGLNEKYFCENEVNTQIRKIGYAGMIAKRKGFDMLAGAIKSLNGSSSGSAGFDWCIAYNMIKDKLDISVEELGSYTNVHFSENIRPDDMPAFYDSLDLLVLPSRQDPLPTVVIEAMARHRLVIGFDIGGVRELLNDEELIIKEITQDALEKKIQEVSSWPYEKRVERSDRLYQRAKTIFAQNNKREHINRDLIELCN